MLRIKLSPPYLLKRKYVVFIDRDLKRSFSNKRMAESFLTAVENELNESLLFINESFCNLSTFYRTYFMADRDFKFKYEIENLLDLVNNRLNYISAHSASDNYNTMISHALNVSFDALSGICDGIERKSRSRYDMLTRRRILLHKKIISQYRESFNVFHKEAFQEPLLKAKIA